MSASPEPRRYEFNSKQNRVFKDLHATMMRGGLLLAAAGALMLVMVMVRLAQKEGFHLEALLPGVVFVLIGLFMQRASTSFSQIVDTRGNDVDHLMKALESLWGMFRLLQGSALAAVVLMVLWIGVSLAF